VLFIQKYTDQVWNKPYANPQEYPFDDLKSAFKAFRDICSNHDVDSFEGVLNSHYYPVPLPVQGGLVAKPDTEGLTGYSYGVCYNGFGYFVGDDGLVAIELNPATDLYWSVE
jgi:hypothetical protein